MKVSVIVPTLNRANLLARTLLTLIHQNCPRDFEIIIVDNGSTDNTKEVVEKLESLSPYRIRYLYDARPGLLVGRHVGARAAEGDILSFVDDDVIVPPCWVENIYRLFSNTNVSLATGNNLPFFEDIKPDWLDFLWRNCEHGRYLGELSLLDFGNEPKEITAAFVWGLNYHIRKNILIDVGGFHPDILSRQFEIYVGDGETGIWRELEKNGYRAFFEPGLSLYHTVTKERMTKDYFIKRSYIQGMMNSYTDIRYPRIEENKSASSDKRSLARRMVGRLKKLFWVSDEPKNPLEKEANLLREKMAESSRQGYEKHQEECKRNPKLREYIQEKDYFHDLDRIYRQYLKVDG